MYSSPPYDLSQLALIAVAYSVIGQACCGTGNAPASLGEQALSRATPDLRTCTSLLSDPNTERQSHVLQRI
jgi:hypothetical protein